MKYSIKNYYNFNGIDMSKDLVNRGLEDLIHSWNIYQDVTGTYRVRPGYRILCGAGDYSSSSLNVFDSVHGVHLYSRYGNAVSVSSGALDAVVQNTTALKEDKLAIGTIPKRLETGTITITNGTGQTVYIRCFGGNLQASLSETWDIYTINLPIGTGLEVSPLLLSDLVPIFSNANITMTIGAGVNSNSVASGLFIPETSIANTLSLVCDYNYFLPVSLGSVVGAVDTDGYSAIPYSEWVGSSVILNNVLYYTIPGNTSGAGLYKYDGANAIYVGIASMSSVLAAAGVSGGTFGKYEYAITLQYKDFQGNYVESDPVYTGVVDASAKDSIVLTLSSDFVHRKTGTNSTKWGAVSRGAQTGVTTITCDDGNGNDFFLDLGDTIFFKDSSGNECERIVTARTLKDGSTYGTITISGAAVTLNDNTAISAARVNIYRTTNGPGQIFYHLSSRALDITSSVFTNTDNTADATLITRTRYIEPLVSHAPIGRSEGGPRVIGTYNGLLLVGYNNELRFSDIENPEYFPPENVISLPVSTGDVISGIVSSQEGFIIFKEKSSYVVTGDLTTGNFKVDVYAGDIGCASPHTIRHIDDMFYWTSSTGVYRGKLGSAPEKLSSRIQYVFKSYLESADGTIRDGFEWKLAGSFYDRDRRLYGVVLHKAPNELGAYSYYVFSRTFVYSIDSGKWWEWKYANTEGNFSAPMSNWWNVGKDVYATRRLGGSATLVKIQNTGNIYDYEDSSKDIWWIMFTGFDCLGEPFQQKQAGNFSLIYAPFQGIERVVLEQRGLLGDYSYPKDPFSLSVRTCADFVPYGIHSQFDLSVIPEWSESKGAMPVGKLKDTQFRAIAYRLSGTVNCQEVGFNGFSVEYKLGIDPHITGYTSGTPNAGGVDPSPYV